MYAIRKRAVGKAPSPRKQPVTAVCRQPSDTKWSETCWIDFNIQTELRYRSGWDLRIYSVADLKTAHEVGSSASAWIAGGFLPAEPVELLVLGWFAAWESKLGAPAFGVSSMKPPTTRDKEEIEYSTKENEASDRVIVGMRLSKSALPHRMLNRRNQHHRPHDPCCDYSGNLNHPSRTTTK